MEIFDCGTSAPTSLALRTFIDAIVGHISPKLNDLSEKLDNDDSKKAQDTAEKNVELFALCKDQILKCACLMADIFKREISNSCIMEDSRLWVLNRISWCLDKLDRLEDCSTGKLKSGEYVDLSDAKIKLSKSTIDLNLFTNDEFISWIDDSTDLLILIEKLFADDNNDFVAQGKNSMKRNQWVKECSSTLFSLHKVIRELILSAMNICHNSLSVDQHIINARCHVVLRESKNLMTEIVSDSKLIINECDEPESSNIRIKDNLHFSTVRLFISTLKSAIHTLEACINRAVLGLVLKCLTDPIKNLSKIVHISELDNENDPKMQMNKEELEEVDKSTLLKDFDIHCEQTTQIGLFAISCSADKHRVLQVKSCLASLEILDTHLIPTILSSPDSLHAQFLRDHWNQEIGVLRNCVFLIVDPFAFIDLVVELFQEKINVIRLESPLKWLSTRPLIDLGKCVLDYFNVYFECEPQIFKQNENLHIIINDMKKVIKECQVVGNLFLMNPNNPTVKDKVSEFEKSAKERRYQEHRVMKRLKLLYSLIVKIVKELVKDDQTFDDNEASISALPQDTYSLATPLKAHMRKTENLQISDSKGKGIFKFFEKFKLSNKNCTDKENEAIQNTNKTENLYFGNKTFSRTTIMRSTNKKTNLKITNDSCSVTLGPIMTRLKKINNDSRDISLRDFISASGILNGLNDDFLLTNISQESKSKTAINQNNVKGEDIVDGNSASKNESAKARNSIFYNYPRSAKRQVSLRRKVLINQVNETSKRCSDLPIRKPLNFSTEMKSLQNRSVESLNQSLDLHITDILEQLTKLSDTMSLMKINSFDEGINSIDAVNLNSTITKIENIIEPVKNVLTLKINENNVSPKKVWNIQVSQDEENFLKIVDNNISNSKNTDDKENVALATPKYTKQSTKVNFTNKTPAATEKVDCEIDISFGSDIPTPERLNDLRQLELKLADLKQFWKK